MKRLYTFTQYEMLQIQEWLIRAKQCLDSDSKLRIEGCKAAIDNALREMVTDDDDRISEVE